MNLAQRILNSGLVAVLLAASGPRARGDPRVRERVEFHWLRRWAMRTAAPTG